MGRQGVARQQSVAIAAFNQSLHRIAAVLVKSNRRTEHPGDVAMLAIMAQNFVKIIIRTGKRGFPGAPGTESKFIRCFISRRIKPGRMNIDPLFTILGAPDGNRITLFDSAGFHNVQHIIPEHQNRIHPALRCQQPLSGPQMDIFGIVGGSVIIYRHHSIHGSGRKFGSRRIDQAGL